MEQKNRIATTRAIKRQLKPEHAIVLKTVKVANLACRRVVNNPEIVKVLSSNDVAALKRAYHQPLYTIVSKVLTLLQARGLIFTPGKIGSNRYYGAVAILDPATVTLPNKQSRRRRALELVRGAVAGLGRAVRVDDVCEFAAKRPDADDLSQADLVHDVLSLAQTGELSVVGTVRGESNGLNLYLPSDLEPSRYVPTEPLTWIEEVARAFNEVWFEHQEQATAAGKHPRPVSTGEVRARWVASPQANPKAHEPQPVVNAMSMLSQRSRRQAPLLRKIRRKGEKAILWAPVGISEELLDIGDAYASDAERIGTAVQRAIEQLGRPVTIRDVADEVELDPTLRPAGSSSLYKVLADTSKKTIDIGNGVRKERSTRRVYRVGTLGNETYYFHRAEGLEKAKSYVELQRIDSIWSATRAEERLGRIDTRKLLSVAIGGAMLIEVEAGDIVNMLNSFLFRQMDGATRNEAEILRKIVSEVISKARGWLVSRNVAQQNLPQNIRTQIPGWIAEELLPILYPFYPNIRKDKDGNDLTRLLFHEIRRIPNPKFESRFSKDPHTAAEFLFDRTDALFYAAKKWGGLECNFQARLASSELGWLRDVRFVFPALCAKEVETRLAAVACLAFLWSEEGNKYLRRMAVEDAEPGVRQSALWAYGFANGIDAAELVSWRKRDDTNVHVRTIAEKASMLCDKGWWAL